MLDPRLLLHTVVNGADAETLRKLCYCSLLNDAGYSNNRLQQLAQQFQQDAYDEAKAAQDRARVALAKAERQLSRAQQEVQKECNNLVELGQYPVRPNESNNNAEEPVDLTGASPAPNSVGPSASGRKKKQKAEAKKSKSGPRNLGPRKSPAKSPTKRKSPNKRLAKREAGFKHKAHYLQSERSKSGYKGVVPEKGREPYKWRVKYAGATAGRYETLQQACDAYYELCKKNGPSDIRKKKDALDIINQFD